MKYEELAIDTGYSNFKIAFGPGKALVPHTLVFPAGVGPATAMSELISGPEANLSDSAGVRVSVNGKVFVAGVDQTHLTVKRHRNPRYPLTDEYMALVYMGFMKANATLLNARNLDREQIDLVVLVGGGAEFYRLAADKAFPGARLVVPPRPVAANVRGFWYMQRACSMTSARGMVGV